MKTLLRSIIFYGLGLVAISQFFPGGIHISGGFLTYVWSSIILSLLALIVRPVIKVLTIPLQFITFGLFTFVIDAIILYLLTVFLPQIRITAFTIPGYTLNGFVIPPIAFNLFLAYIFLAFCLFVIVSALRWVSD